LQKQAIYFSKLKSNEGAQGMNGASNQWQKGKNQASCYLKDSQNFTHKKLQQQDNLQQRWEERHVTAPDRFQREIATMAAETSALQELTKTDQLREGSQETCIVGNEKMIASLHASGIPWSILAPMVVALTAAAVVKGAAGSPWNTPPAPEEKAFRPLSARPDQLQQFSEVCYTRTRIQNKQCNSDFNSVRDQSTRNAHQTSRDIQTTIMRECRYVPGSVRHPDPVRDRVIRSVVEPKIYSLARIEQTRGAHNPQNYGDYMDMLEEKRMRFVPHLSPDQFVLQLFVDVDGKHPHALFFITSYEILKKKMDSGSNEQKAFLNKYFGNLFQATRPFQPFTMGHSLDEQAKDNKLFWELVFGAKNGEIGNTEEANNSFICDTQIASALSHCSKKEQEFLLKRCVIRSMEIFLRELPTELEAGKCENDAINRRITEFVENDNRAENQAALDELVGTSNVMAEFMLPRRVL
jgi:hypothetical protein